MFIIITNKIVRKYLNYRTLCIILISLGLSLFVLYKKGQPIENFEARIYQNISGKKPQHFKFDSSGVPIVMYEGNLGNKYNPVTVAERAINWSDEKDTLITRKFYNCIQWLVDNSIVINDSSILFPFYFDWPSYNMVSPWRSAMSQGRAMQAFLRAFQKTGDSLYFYNARKSMNTLLIEVKDGGVTYIDSLGYWYEEYADDNVPPSRVLNGMIVVLQGLSEYNEITHDTLAQFLFKEGVRSVKNTLYKYDNKGHSNYDMLGKPAPSWYHNFHIELLDFLYKKTQEPIFNEYSVKWQQYQEPSYLARLVKKPTRIGIFTVFTVFFTIFILLFAISYNFWFRSRNV
jgi:hypothetical protein